ncbi:MAG: DUF4345 domain-containing protein [Bacteroidota bacterium]
MKAFILVNSAAFLLFGLGFVFFPETLSLYLTDSAPATPSGMTDMRATYGGISLGLGIVLVLMSQNPAFHSLGTKAATIIVGGMAVGRTIGMLQDGAPNEFMFINLGLEVVIVVVGLVLLMKSEGREGDA